MVDSLGCGSTPEIKVLNPQQFQGNLFLFPLFQWYCVDVPCQELQAESHSCMSVLNIMVFKREKLPFLVIL